MTFGRVNIAIPLIVFSQLLVSNFLVAQPADEDDINISYLEEPIDLKQGITISGEFDPEESALLEYTINPEVAQKFDRKFSHVRLTLVRTGVGLKSMVSKDLEEIGVIDFSDLLAGANTNDHIVIEWKLRGVNLSYSPKIMALKLN